MKFLHNYDTFFSKPVFRNQTSVEYRFSPEPVILHHVLHQSCDSALLPRRWARETGGSHLAAMLISAGKRPTLRPGDSQMRAYAPTHSHKQTLSSRLSGQECVRACVCVCVKTVLSRRGWQWRDTGEIIMSPKQGWQRAARALQLSVNCHYHRAWYTAWGERETEGQTEANGKRKGATTGAAHPKLAMLKSHIIWSFTFPCFKIIQQGKDFIRSRC